MNIFAYQKDTEHFYTNTMQVYRELESQRNSVSMSADDFYQRAEIDLYNYNIEKITLLKSLSPCQKCEYIKTMNKVDIYMQESNEYLAVYRLSNAIAAITISEDLYDANVEKGVGDDIILLGTFAFMLFLIALNLYRPIRKLQLQINHLVAINHTFGNGDLTARVDIKTTPLLHDLSTSFNAMAKAITERVDEGAIFAQALPHEVRTPLSRIQLAVGLLKQDLKQKKHTDLLDSIDDYVDDMVELSEQITTFSRVSSKHSCCNEDEQSIELAHFIHSRIMLYDTHSNINISFHAEDESTIQSSPMCLRLAFDNLLKNMLNHASSHVEVNVIQLAKTIKITVEDDGPGIPPENYHQIFIPFARLDKSRSRKTGGLGLGLPIAKSASKRLGGRIIVSKSKLGGAKFTLIIPTQAKKQGLI
ncbi:ATP-binding protein [Moritella sp. 24]|uniref:ATP-binding protein n=1 Tax=Moritella sp. 24 TaxID=2746230 RepID=UPI001BA885EE|nr:ATP-binding protein [Moritella sp. 24]QUM77308.1 ATP-binding protein [Moritella sp. 24]